MFERIRQVRERLGVSQKKFADALGVSQSMITMIETGRRVVTERHIKSICAVYNVNEEWLRTGAGEMFRSTPDVVLDDLTNEYQLDSFMRGLVARYLALSPENRAVVRQFLGEIEAMDAEPEPIDDEARARALVQTPRSEWTEDDIRFWGEYQMTLIRREKEAEERSGHFSDPDDFSA